MSSQRRPVREHGIYACGVSCPFPIVVIAGGDPRSPKLWRQSLFLPFPLMGNEAKGSRPTPSASPRPSKGLTLRSRSAFCEGKRQAPLSEGQALSRPLQALPRPSAGARAPNPVEGGRSHSRRFHLLFLCRHRGLDPRSPTPKGGYTRIIERP